MQIPIKYLKSKNRKAYILRMEGMLKVLVIVACMLYTGYCASHSRPTANRIAKGDEIFDVGMGFFDGAEICELVGLFLLEKLCYLGRSNSNR